MKRAAAVWFLGVGFIACGVPGRAEAPLDPLEEDCPDCESGLVQCTRCGGKKVIPQPCPKCQGAQSLLCTRPGCNSGQKRCPACGGTGSKRAVVFGIRRRGETPAVQTCRPSIPCGGCTGGLVDCKACTDGTSPLPCPNCEKKKGWEECLRCGGKGVLTREPVPAVYKIEPSAESAESLEFFKANAVARAGAMEGSVKRLEKFAPACEQSLARFAKLETRVLELQGLAATETGLAPAMRNLESNWRICERTAKRVQRLLDRAAELAPLTEEHLGSLRAIAKRQQVISDESNVRDLLDKHALHARDLRDTADQMSYECTSLSESLERREQEVKSLSTKYHARLAEKARQESEKAALQKAFKQVIAQLPEIAKRCGLPPVECELLASSRPGALHVHVDYFDTEVLVEEGADAVPTDAALSILPPFISAVFKSCPDVKKIEAVIEATWVGETGLDEMGALQKFTMDRGRWQELTAGRYKDSWEKILSLSKPMPPYPRPAVTGWWPFLILLGILVLGLGFIYLSRSSMFSR